MARPHTPVFTDDSGGRMVTVQWGGRVIAVACVALWAALALTLGTQVSLPGLDRMPSLSDGLRRAIFPDPRMDAVPDADRRAVERGLVSGVEVARTSPRPVGDTSKGRAEVVPQGTTKESDQTKAVIKKSGTERDPSVRTRSAAAKPVATVPANPNSRKSTHASGPSTVKPNPHANPRAKAVLAKAVVAKAKARGKASPGPSGKPHQAKAAKRAPQINPNPRPGNGSPADASGQRPAGRG
jgi:hypothetical protein